MTDDTLKGQFAEIESKWARNYIIKSHAINFVAALVRIHTLVGIILPCLDGILFYCRATPDVSLLLTVRRNLPSLGSFQYSDFDISIYSQLSPCGHPAVQLAITDTRIQSTHSLQTTLYNGHEWYLCQISRTNY